MKQLSRRELSKIVVKSIDSKELEKRIRQVSAHMIETGRAKQIDLLIRDIESELMRTKKHVTAHVSSVFPLEKSVRQSIEKEVKKMTHASDVEIIESIDPSLLGGTVIATPEMEVDLSLKGRLKRLKEVEI